MIPFEKYSGLGNDFIFIDNRSLNVDLNSNQIQKMCHRTEGVGADGIILVEPSQNAHCKMRIFNSDGSEAEMCGNALRCLYLFLNNLGLTAQSYQIETKERLLNLSSPNGADITCDMGDVEKIEGPIDLEFNGQTYQGYFLNTGVPHVVIPVQNLHRIPLLALGAHIRHHPHFGPSGTNVNLISIDQQKVVHIRTYERGVEDETRACGTGSAAAAITAHHLYRLPQPVSVQPISKGSLRFNFELNYPSVKNLTMSGTAQFIFKGSLALDSFLLCR